MVWTRKTAVLTTVAVTAMMAVVIVPVVVIRNQDTPSRAAAIESPPIFTGSGPSPQLIFSDYPSFRPSDAPSSSPSAVPSDAESSTPSDVPSMPPSSIPTLLPNSAIVSLSDAPSDEPSDVPSVSPTERPTPAPFVNTGSDWPSLNPGSWGSQGPTHKDQALSPVFAKKHRRKVEAIRNRTRRQM